MAKIGKSWLGAALAFVFASVLVMLAPTSASAFNIEGMIRGALGHGYGGGGRHHARGGESRHHERRHASRHERRDRDDDSASSDKGKDKDALEDNTTGQKGSDSKQDAKVSRETPATPSHDAAQASGASSAKPNKSSDDEPSFAPSR